MISRLAAANIPFVPLGKSPEEEDLFFEAVGQQYEVQFPIETQEAERLEQLLLTGAADDNLVNRMLLTEHHRRFSTEKPIQRCNCHLFSF